MQFYALYNKQNGNGLYFGTHDSAPSAREIEFPHSSSEISWRPSHFPPNITFPTEDFFLGYDCVVGPFRGDWYDACQIYRKWALKQSWCRKGPLATREDVPKWYKEAPLYFYSVLGDTSTGTHSEEENLSIAAEHMREFLRWTEMRLPVNFYGWKDYQPARCAAGLPYNPARSPTLRVGPEKRGGWFSGMQGIQNHDGNYPKIGALHNFSTVCKDLREDGGMACPYVALGLFDQGAAENSPYVAEARPNILRGLHGVMRTWPGEALWEMCPAKPSGGGTA